MSTPRPFRVDSGMTFVEILVAASVLGMLVVTLSQVFVRQKKFLGQQQSQDAESAIVRSLLSQIRARVEIFPKSFTPLDPSQFSSDLNIFVRGMNAAAAGRNWSHAWSQDFFGPVAECPTCPGRAIYLIDQVKVCGSGSAQECAWNLNVEDQTQYYLGLYRVRVVLYNKKAFISPPHAREYYFTVVSR